MPDLELRHRRRARCEDRIRIAKNTGLTNLPLATFDANRIWCAVVALAAEITAWMQMLAFTDTPARRWEPKKLRYRIFTIPTTLARTGRRVWLHLSGRSPWSADPDRTGPPGPPRRRLTAAATLPPRPRPTPGTGAHPFLSAVFKAAVGDRRIASSPCVGVCVPRPRKVQVVPVETTAVHALTAVMPERWRAAVTLAAGTGMRQGEVFGLTVDRIDFLRRQVVVDALAAHLAAFPPGPDASCSRPPPGGRSDASTGAMCGARSRPRLARRDLSSTA